MAATKTGRKKRGYHLDVPRLCTAIRHGRKVLEFFRVERREAVRQYVGGHWSEDGARVAGSPVNLIAQYVNIITRSLVAKAPRVLLSSDELSARPQVAAMQAWADREIQAMMLEKTLQRAVIDALFSVGICKVGLATPGDALGAGWNLSAGQPFAERVDLDDFVYDAHARDFAEAGFVGHRYRVHKEAAEAMWGRRGRALPVSDNPQHNEEGDERIDVLGRGWYGVDADEYCEMVDLWEVYVPKYRRVVTLAADRDGTPDPNEDPLDDREWLGPDHGPYHFLCLGVVPGNAMPKAPVMDLIDLHVAANQQFRKLLAQARRQKEVALVRGTGTEDGQTVQQADDGDMIRVDDPSNIAVMNYGGANPALFSFFGATKELFSWLAGNLDAMGGLSPQAKTATQDKLLAEATSRNVADMQATTVNFAASVLRSLGWYWWHDPVRTMESVYEVEGLPEFAAVRRVTPQQRQAVPWDRLDVKVDPYSMQPSTPSGRAQALMTLVTQVLAPMMGLLQQQGVAFDAGEFLRVLGGYMDMPDLKSFLAVQDPPEAARGGGAAGGAAQAGAGMPANTSRSYTRESVSGRSHKGTMLGLSETMAGADLGGDPGGSVRRG